jgi:transcriptional regulator with XRE-family HTH domain
MTELQQLLTTLKAELKARGITYRDVATALELSEASVKRLFSTGNLSLDRLVDLCDLLDMTLAELTQTAATSAPRLSRLSEKQEAELVSEPELLLVATCALNQWRLADIIESYQLDEAKCLHHLLRLDRMRLIDLLPGNRIRVNVTRDFDWLPHGPIARFFASRGRDDFLSGTFGSDDESVFFVHGMLTQEARRHFIAQLRKLRKQFASLHDESQHAAIGERHGTAMLLAMREWEPPDFVRLRRTQTIPSSSNP